VGRLFWKLFFAFWLTLGVTVASTGVTTLWLGDMEIRAKDSVLAADKRHKFVLEMAASLLRHGGAQALREWMAEASTNVGMVPPLYAINEAGQDILQREPPADALARARQLTQDSDQASGALRVATPVDGRLLLFIPLALAPQPPDNRPPLWVLLLMGTLASAAVSAALAYYLTRPIHSLRWAFNAAAAGALDTRVASRIGKRRDEIADLGGDFDRMVHRLEILLATQKRLLRDISHEFRSPLARLHAAVGLARQDDSKLGISLIRIEKEAERLDKMLGETLTLARLENGCAQMPRESFDLAELIEDVAEDARFEAWLSHRQVHFLKISGVFVDGNPEMLRRAIDNIIRNAVRHTAEGSAVEVSLTVDSAANDQIEIKIKDYGQGVAESDLEHIFEAFYRGQAERTADGFGLGLAIADSAIRAHGGSVVASNVAGAGLLVTIRLSISSMTTQLAA